MKQKQRMFGILAALVLLLALGVVLTTRYTAQKTAADEAASSEAAVQATRADSMVTALCSLTSNRVITGADPAQYGMTDPVVTVMYTLADGTENTLYFGDTNPVTGDVYLTVTEDSAVYTVSASKCNVFRYTAAELEDTEQSETVSGSDSQ